MNMCFELTRASERKRRGTIRDKFDELATIIPGMAGMARSEGIVLHEAVTESVRLLKERKELVENLEKSGVAVDPKMKE